MEAMEEDEGLGEVELVPIPLLEKKGEYVV